MTGNPLLDLLISVLGVAILVGACAALGGWRTARIRGVDDAAARLRAEAPEFTAERWLLAPDGLSALARGGDRTAVVRVLGDSTAVRVVPGIPDRPDGDALVVDLGDPGFPAFRLPPGPWVPA